MTNDMPRIKRIALVAHDQMKPAMLDWAESQRDVLQRHQLWGTGTTGSRVAEKTGLDVTCLRSGPLGGDQQIGALIAEGRIDAVVFFVDPLTPMPHDVDVKALMRLAIVYDIPLALNRASAEILLKDAMT